MFDSLGTTEDFIRKLFKKQEGLYAKIKCDFNTTRVQKTESTTCGYFCIYFIVERLFNDDLCLIEVLNEIFFKGEKRNESVVSEFVQELKGNHGKQKYSGT